jgi:hypothetical protein
VLSYTSTPLYDFMVCYLGTALYVPRCVKSIKFSGHIYNEIRNRTSQIHADIRVPHLTVTL